MPRAACQLVPSRVLARLDFPGARASVARIVPLGLRQMPEDERSLVAGRQGPPLAAGAAFQQVAAEGLAQMYFRANNTRAHGLGVEFTDIEHIQIDL
ncbi:hypothetical protein [Streptomyces sp. NPDC059080]|uniref:hypothetical protein n=1 Tax=Streptomyces sp. NPDC059080 TaxID=3346718 RepID=UPI0036C3A4BE